MQNLFLPSTILVWSVGQILILCEFGERLAHQFLEINDEIFRSNWYKLPIDIKKMLPIIVNGTQHPIVISGIGDTECTRETFKNVSNLAL